MNRIKKYILHIMLLAVFIICTHTANAAPFVIYENSSSKIITSGAILHNTVKFTSDGWLNINVLQVDLSNKNIKVDTMINPSLLKLMTVKAMAQNNNAIAAINGGFFNWLGNGGYPDGSIVSDKKIVTASSEYNKYNDSMATLSINKFNNILYEFWKTDINILTEHGNSIHVTSYNKASILNYNDITVWDTKWSDMSLGNTNYSDIIEVVVKNDSVVGIRENLPATKIPENGYIIITRAANRDIIYNTFSPGSKIQLNIETTPSWTSQKTAITGSAILLKDGVIPQKFSFDIAGRQPRTAIGSSQDNKTLFLVTVDGRQNKSIGMTQYELAEYMQSIGIYNALNLDGGGSTTMVAREPGSDELKIVNNPSDGGERTVSTAFGIFSTSAPAALKGLILDTQDTNVLLNTPIKFNVKAYDENYNPLSVSIKNISWKASGIKGWFEDNVFYPTSIGTGKITATMDNAYGSIEITVTSDSTSEEVQDPNDLPDKSSEDFFSFGIIGNLPKPKNLLQKILLSRLSEKQFDLSYVIENNTGSSLNTSIMTTGDYDFLEHKTSIFLKLDTSKQGIRTTNLAQWSFLLEKLNTLDKDNIFIILSSPLSKFTDQMEAELFKNILTKKAKGEGKNICVFYGGDKNQIYMENNVRYVETAGFNIGEITPLNMDDVKYTHVDIENNKINIKFETVR